MGKTPERDKLIISDLQFRGYCGVTEEEKKVGHRFSLDLEIVYDLKSASASDSIEDTVNYATLSRFILEMVKKERTNLVETLAERIAQAVIKEFGIDEILVRLKKCLPPVEGIKDYFAVEIRRKKNG